MANDERDPADLLIGGVLIVFNVGLTLAGAFNFGGGLAGSAVYIIVPGVAAWAVSCLIRRRRQPSGPAP